MAPWRIWDYATAGRNLIADWYEAQDVAVQARFDEVLLLARAEPNWLDEDLWWIKPLERDHEGLWEFRFTVKGRLWERKFRPVGILREKERDFIFLLGCEKKMGGLIYDPVGAFDTALIYKADFEAGKGALYEHV